MDEFFTEKTMAADPLEDQTPKENPAEAPNPYEARPNPASFEQPKPQYQPPQPQYMPPQYQPPQYQQPPQYMPPQQQYMQQPPQYQPLLFVLLMAAGSTTSTYKYASSRGALAAVALAYGFIISVPGLVFGIVALSKKTNKFPLAILGTIFSGALILFGIIMLMTVM